MARANVALAEGENRAARLLDMRDDGVRLLACVIADLREIGAPDDVQWRLMRALHLLTVSSDELRGQRKRNRKLEKRAPAPKPERT